MQFSGLVHFSCCSSQYVDSPLIETCFLKEKGIGKNLMFSLSIVHADKQIETITVLNISRCEVDTNFVAGKYIQSIHQVAKKSAI